MANQQLQTWKLNRSCSSEPKAPPADLQDVKRRGSMNKRKRVEHVKRQRIEIVAEHKEQSAR